MSDSLGLTSVATQALSNLAAGPVKTMALPVASGATPTIGQVMVYNATNHNFEDFAAYSEGDILVIFADRVLHDAEGTALTEAKTATCVVAGAVNLSALDATAQADADIVAGLLQNRMFAESAVLA